MEWLGADSFLKHSTEYVCHSKHPVTGTSNKDLDYVAIRVKTFRQLCLTCLNEFVVNTLMNDGVVSLSGPVLLCILYLIKLSIPTEVNC